MRIRIQGVKNLRIQIRSRFFIFTKNVRHKSKKRTLSPDQNADPDPGTQENTDRIQGLQEGGSGSGTLLDIANFLDPTRSGSNTIFLHILTEVVCLLVPSGTSRYRTAPVPFIFLFISQCSEFGSMLLGKS